MNRRYSVGAYIRLSVEDTVQDSDSVENQREMLSLFIDQMPGWIAHRFYVDNGVSGGAFDRPAFREMMADVRSGTVNLIIVKDMSRWGAIIWKPVGIWKRSFPLRAVVLWP